jgi:YD repeat-containing protein
MKSRPFFLALLGVALLSALGGQEGAASGDEGAGLFPLGMLLDTAVLGEAPWRPDWPAAMPPDGFTLNAGQARALTLILPAGYAEAPPGGGDTAETADTVEGGDEEATVEYRLVRDMAGRFLEFPFIINGALYQGTVEYDGGAAAQKISLDNPSDSPAAGAADSPGNAAWEFELLEYRQGDPVLARINANGTWSFVAPEYQETRTRETWYDAEGRAQGFFSLEYRLEDGAKRLLSTDRRSDQQETILAYRYNSAGRVSAINAPEGDYTALYNAEARPRYWERPEGSYVLQWDERGLLVRLTGITRNAGADTGAEANTEAAETTEADAEGRQLDIRYEYALDERGNWIERRETSFARRFGRLVPQSNATIRRIILYGDT